jgi:hypothetical protein
MQDLEVAASTRTRCVGAKRLQDDNAVRLETCTRLCRSSRSRSAPTSSGGLGDRRISDLNLSQERLARFKCSDSELEALRDRVLTQVVPVNERAEPDQHAALRDRMPVLVAVRPRTGSEVEELDDLLGRPVPPSDHPEQPS